MILETCFPSIHVVGTTLAQNYFCGGCKIEQGNCTEENVHSNSFNKAPWTERTMVVPWKGERNM